MTYELLRRTEAQVAAFLEERREQLERERPILDYLDEIERTDPEFLDAYRISRS